MSDQKRRFLERASIHAPSRASTTPTFIGPETVFVGNIRGIGQFIVSGEVHGDGELASGLILSITG